MHPNDQAVFAVAALLVLTAVIPRLWRWCRGKKWHRATGLDAPLLAWNREDVLTVRNLLAGGLHAFGRTDAGKSSSLKRLAAAILRHKNSSLLVLCAKRGEYREWLAAAKAAKRSADVMLIDLSQPWRFNMVGYEATRQGEGAGQAANVVRFIMEVRSAIFRENAQLGGESQQWRKQDEQLLLNAVTVLMLAGVAVTPANLHSLILSAPESTAQLDDAGWQARDCNHWLAQAFVRDKTPIEQHDFQLASDYFLRLWPRMADRTRGSILAGTMATLTVMNTGLCREMFACRTNFNPKDAIEQRKIVIVNAPPDEFGDFGIVSNVGLKYHWQSEILRRDINDRSPICCIWGDESSLWVTPSDARFLSRCRSYRGSMVYICQGLNSYREALSGEKSDAVVEAMLSNFSHKLFFALGDHATARWAADHVGKELQQFAGGGVQYAPYEALSFLRGPSQTSSSYSEHFEDVIQPSSFMNGLRTGSPANDYLVDGILVRSGVPFANGLPYLYVTFDQRS
jgi:hypothetical protein